MTIRTKMLASVTAITIAAASGSALAQNVDEQLANDLQRYGYDVSAMELSTSDAAELRNIVYSDRSRAAKERQVQQILAEKDWPGFAFANMDVRSYDAQVIENRLMTYGIEVEGENLSPAQISEIRAVFGGQEPWNQKKRQIQQVLSDTDFVNYEGVGMLRDQLEPQLDALGIDADLAALTDGQVVEIQSILTGLDDTAAAKRRVQEIINMG